MLLFLPVPIVLVLFTRLPLGPIVSLGVGLLMMLTHPLYTRPWVLRNAERRCLWCGKSRTDRDGDSRRTSDTSLAVKDPRGRATFHHCSGQHRGASERTLSFARRFRAGLRLGVLGSLLTLVVVIVVCALQQGNGLEPQDGVAAFQIGVALAVLPLGWWGSRGHESPLSSNDARAPFPIHIAATIGITGVLWLFRIIGLLWLVQGIRYFVVRS